MVRAGYLDYTHEVVSAGALRFFTKGAMRNDATLLMTSFNVLNVVDCLTLHMIGSYLSRTHCTCCALL